MSVLPAAIYRTLFPVDSRPSPPLSGLRQIEAENELGIGGDTHSRKDVEPVFDRAMPFLRVFEFVL